ncbi:MAG: leucyl aminopeptidase, partial [Actinomycetota bacterium]
YTDRLSHPTETEPMSRTPQVLAADIAPTTVTGDALVLFAFSEEGSASFSGVSAEIDKAFGGALKALPGFAGKVGQTVLVPSLDKVAATNVVIVGLGPRQDLMPAVLRRASAEAARRLRDVVEIVSVLHQASDDPGAAQASVEGFLLGSYRYTDWKSDPKPPKLQRVVLLGAPEEALSRGVAFAEATILARDLTNEPASSLTPRSFARKAQEVADANGLDCTVMEALELEERGFGGLIGVGKGSEEPPVLIKLRYSPGGAAKKKVALVGKGITFDTGGYSIKVPPNMEQMKTDMGGGGAVLGAMSVLARLQPDVEVTAYIPSAENMISGDSLKPGDVIKLYSGKTIEVNNTDAEGRLVLADALKLAVEDGAEAVVDIATLTAHIHIALGWRYSGLFCDNDTLREQIEAAAEVAGEPVWHMPMPDEYLPELDSEVADLKASGQRYGGASHAAVFLKQHLGSEIPWAHLDIAGTGRSDKHRGEVSRGGTGVGARLLLNWIESLRS